MDLCVRLCADDSDSAVLSCAPLQLHPGLERGLRQPKRMKFGQRAAQEEEGLGSSSDLRSRGRLKRHAPSRRAYSRWWT